MSAVLDGDDPEFSDLGVVSLLSFALHKGATMSDPPIQRRSHVPDLGRVPGPALRPVLLARLRYAAVLEQMAIVHEILATRLDQCGGIERASQHRAQARRCGEQADLQRTVSAA
jgi:hypothetical protein